MNPYTYPGQEIQMPKSKTKSLYGSMVSIPLSNHQADKLHRYCSENRITLTDLFGHFVDRLDSAYSNDVTNKIIIKVASMYHVSSESIKQASRERDIAYARFCAMWMVMKYTGYRKGKTSTIFNRDRSTVYNAINKYETMLSMNDSESQKIASIHSELIKYFNMIFK